MFIRFYDPDTLNELGRTEAFLSFTWTRRFDRPGSFQLVLPLTPENLRLSRLNNYVWHRGDCAGVIEGRVVSTDDRESGPSVTLTGRSLSALLDRRVLPDEYDTPGHYTKGSSHYTYFNGGADGLCYGMVDACSRIPKLVTAKAKTLAELHSLEFYPEIGMNLLDAVRSVSTLKKLGFRVRPDFDAKKLVFEMYKRRNRTRGRAGQAVFSERQGDVLETVRTETTLNACTMELIEYTYPVEYEYGIDNKKYAYTEHWGKPGNLFPSRMSANGILLRAVWPATSVLHCQGAHEGDLEKYPTINLIGQDYCDERLSEKLDAMELTLNGLSRNVVYQRDYDVGDRVTVQKESWGLTADMDVTEAVEVYDRDGPRVSLTVGQLSELLFTAKKPDVQVINARAFREGGGGVAGSKNGGGGAQPAEHGMPRYEEPPPPGGPAPEPKEIVQKTVTMTVRRAMHLVYKVDPKTNYKSSRIEHHFHVWTHIHTIKWYEGAAPHEDYYEKDYQIMSEDRFYAAANAAESIQYLNNTYDMEHQFDREE